MPTAYQSSTSQRKPWESVLGQNNRAGVALRSIFRDFGPNEVCVSRSDLRSLAKETQLDRFVMATILWGYPTSGRGGHLVEFAKHQTDFSTLTQLLASARTQPIADWPSHFNKVAPIKGIKLSTYSKFLTLLSVDVCGKTALILDDKVIRAVSGGGFVELEPLRHMTYSTAPRMYPAYLECIHRISDEWVVPAENTEFFLFEFGLGVKDIEQNIRMRAYQLHAEQGRIDGFALDDWLQAEKEIRGMSKAR